MDDVTGFADAPPAPEVDHRPGAAPGDARPQTFQPGKHRRETLGEEDADAPLVLAVCACLAATFGVAAYQAPQHAYVALQREFASHGIRPDPSAAFDAAFQISRGLRPVSLTAQRTGRHRRPDPGEQSSPP